MKSKQIQEFKETEIGKIPADWKIVELSKLVLKITKGTTPSTIGGKFTENGISILPANCTAAKKVFFFSTKKGSSF